MDTKWVDWLTASFRDLAPHCGMKEPDITPGYTRHVAQCKQWILPYPRYTYLGNWYKSGHLITKGSCHLTSATGTLYEYHKTEEYKHLIIYKHGYLLRLSSRERHQKVSRPQHINITVWIRKKENLNFLQTAQFRYKRFINNNSYLGRKM